MDDNPGSGDTPDVVITDISKSYIAAAGDTFSVYGRGLDQVTKLYIGAIEVGFVIVSSTELLVFSEALPAGTHEIIAISDAGQTIYRDGILVKVDDTVDATPRFWTKDLGNGIVKVYAKNVIGIGKVQFFVNGKERAWVNAIDGSDPKLRQAGGFSYLVRSVALSEASKTRIEIRVNGQRVRFTTYGPTN